jgi:hypothetical protein
VGIPAVLATTRLAPRQDGGLKAAAESLLWDWSSRAGRLELRVVTRA